VTQKPKLPAGTALRAKHLDARKVTVHNRHRGIEDLLEKRFRPLGGDQLSGDLLKMLCGV
jgi:hypothetical protein